MSEFAEYGSLESFICKNKIINYSDFLNGLIHIAKGVQFLLERKILHGDVLAGNILVFPIKNSNRDEFIMKLTDFGCSCLFDKYSSVYCDSEFISFEERVLNEFSSKEEQNSKLYPKIAKEDWYFYSRLLRYITYCVTKHHGVILIKIKKLADLLNKEYFNQGNILQAIQQYFGEDTNILKVKKLKWNQR